MQVIQPVILCGGSGTRLWPLSTTKKPKQYLSLSRDGASFRQLTRERLLPLKREEPTQRDPVLIAADEISDILVGVTSSSEKKRTTTREVREPLFIANRAHQEQYQPNDLVIYEETSQDTAVAIARILSWSEGRLPPDAVILMTPSDHYVDNDRAFITDMERGLQLVGESNIVLFGMTPTYPESKYGYILEGYNSSESDRTGDEKPRFFEKPSREKAQELIAQGALWNSGIFATRVSTLAQAYRDYCPQALEATPDVKVQSFDIEILQRYPSLSLVRCREWGWSDVGTWESWIALSDLATTTPHNSIVSNCSNVYVVNNDDARVVVIGVSNLLVVVNNGSVLVMPPSEHESLKKVVSQYKLG
jgi:mannose-1-phosphate guanylyltransferase